MNKTITLNTEFEKIWTKIVSNENFAFLRYGDGERAIMEGRHVVAQEGWESPHYATKLGEDSLNSLSLTDDKIIYGISCPCCDSASYYWYSTRIANKNITFANLWVNSNYTKFIKSFDALNRDAVFIGNYRAKNKRIGNLNVLDYYSVSDDCVLFWQNESKDLLNEIKNKYGNMDDLLYVVSAGPMSGPIIVELFKNNPNNCYIDFGSSLDVYIHNKITRPYMNKNNKYAKKNCWMYDPKTTDFRVSVVCNLYKRPENLLKQLEAINNQTLKPTEILLYQDGILDNYKIELLTSLKDKFDNVRIATENTGVWKRFDFARTAISPFVCVFDDDTIPGSRWLENCYSCMQKEEGVYGTIGIVLHNPTVYPYHGFLRVGWAWPNNKTTEVDFVGHSWFAKKEYLDYMFDETEIYQNFKVVGEDMCISVQCQKKEIKTFVPPHPYDNHDLFGSLPNYGRVLGNSIQALSLNEDNYMKMHICINTYLRNGWKPIITTNKYYSFHIAYNIIKEQILGRGKVLKLKVVEKIRNHIPKKSCLLKKRGDN